MWIIQYICVTTDVSICFIRMHDWVTHEAENNHEVLYNRFFFSLSIMTLSGKNHWHGIDKWYSINSLCFLMFSSLHVLMQIWFFFFFNAAEVKTSTTNYRNTANTEQVCRWFVSCCVWLSSSVQPLGGSILKFFFMHRRFCTSTIYEQLLYIYWAGV